MLGLCPFKEVGGLVPGRPDEIVKNHPKCSNFYKLRHKCNREIKQPKNVGYLCNFQLTAQSKQSDIGRKIAPSGHPAWYKCLSCLILKAYKTCLITK
jgi:hypothetical protein